MLPAVPLGLPTESRRLPVAHGGGPAETGCACSGAGAGWLDVAGVGTGTGEEGGRYCATWVGLGLRCAAGSLAAPRRRPSRRPGPAGARVPRSPRRPCPTLVWTPGGASVRWGGRSGASLRQPSQPRSPARYAAGHTVHRPAGHTVRYPAGHTVRRRASPPRLPGPSPPRAARPPCRLIPRWIPAAAAASAEYGAALPSARRDNSSIYVRPGRIACALRNFLITVSTE